MVLSIISIYAKNVTVQNNVRITIKDDRKERYSIENNYNLNVDLELHQSESNGPEVRLSVQKIVGSLRLAKDYPISCCGSMTKHFHVMQTRTVTALDSNPRFLSDSILQCALLKKQLHMEVYEIRLDKNGHQNAP